MRRPASWRLSVDTILQCHQMLQAVYLLFVLLPGQRTHFLSAALLAFLMAFSLSRSKKNKRQRNSLQGLLLIA